MTATATHKGDTQLKNSGITRHHFELQTQTGKEFVIVSRNPHPRVNETSVFPANSEGSITSWFEIRAFKSTTTPEEAIRALGYQVTKKKKRSALAGAPVMAAKGKGDEQQ